MLNLKVTPKILGAVLAVISALFSNTSVWSQTQTREATNTCVKFIGRIVESGKKICEGEQINLVNEMMIICYFNPKTLKLQPGVYKADSVCSSNENEVRPKCTLITPDACPNRKGPYQQENAPNIIQPYGNKLINNRPLISWSPVKGSTSYIVQVESIDRKWEKQVMGTQLLYPQDKKELHESNITKITILAMKSTHPISADSSIFYISRQAEKINQAIQKVKSLNLPLDEVVADLDAIYMSEGLLNETIDFLKEQVAASSFSPTVYRMLGDRYVEVWQGQKAKAAYTKALQLARFKKNKEELEIVGKRLELLNAQSQLPTRINPAQ